MVDYKPLSHYLAQLLRGYSSIYITDKKFFKKKLFRENPLQAIAVDMLLRNNCICKGVFCGRRIHVIEYNGWKIEVLGFKGSTPSELYYPCQLESRDSRAIVSYNDLLGEAIDRPLIVVDNSLYCEHHVKDRNRLVLQESLLLKEIRRFLWDRHYILNNTPKELAMEFNKITGLNKVIVSEDNVLPQIIRRGDNIVILDPYADKVLHRERLLETTVIVIGGIVDRERPVREATKRIAERLRESIVLERYRLEIDGIRQAIPHRLNILARIILETIFYNKPLRQTIIENMANRDLAWYIGLRIVRYGDKLEDIIREIERIRKTSIPRQVIEKALRIAGKK